MKKLNERIINRQLSVLNEILETLGPQVIDRGHPADRVLSRFFKAHRELGSRDRRFLSEAFFSFFRWFGWTRKLDLNVPESAALGWLLDHEELHPALEGVGRADWTPLGGKTLDEKLSALNNLFQGLENVDATPSSRFQPLEKSDLVFPMLGPERSERGSANAEQRPKGVAKSVDFPADSENLFYETLQQRPPTWLRLRAYTFKRVLDEKGVEYQEHPRISGAVSVSGGTSLGALGHGGQFEIQDIASQAVALIAAPEPGSDWWDACSGAGGKSLHLADLIGPEGKVLATDVRENALRECKKRARANGISTVRTQLHDLAKDAPFTKQWDGVLVDAPCSGWGTWSRNPDARWRSDPRDPAQKRNLQVRMLNHAAECVKPGGTLVYAVCTFTREETAETVARFREDHPGFQLEPFNHPLTGDPTDGTLQIWPWEGPGDGMFICRFCRTSGL